MHVSWFRYSPGYANIGGHSAPAAQEASMPAPESQPAGFRCNDID
jgi:hypothetical protein